MKLKSACTAAVVCCTDQSTITSAARRMREYHVGHLVVLGDRENGAVPVGIISEREIVAEVVGRNLDPHSIKVASVMSAPVVVADESEDVCEAMSRMRSLGATRIVITGTHGLLAGVFSLDDLMKLDREGAALAST